MQATLGNTLKALREAKRLTLKEAADALAIDLSMLARIEKGQRAVSEGLFSRLASLFGVEERQLRTLSLADKIYEEAHPHEFATDALKLVQKRITEKEQ